MIPGENPNDKPATPKLTKEPSNQIDQSGETLPDPPPSSISIKANININSAEKGKGTQTRGKEEN